MMKPRTSLFALSFSAGLLALTLTGCSSFSGRSAGPDATKPVGGKAINLLQLRDNVKATRVSLNRTTDALNRIPTAPNAQEAYASFSLELAAFKKLSAETLQDSADVRNRGRELFTQWDLETQSIKNPDIRAIAEKRRSALSASYNEMITPLITARVDLADVTSDLTDIQKALSLDLTPAGIDAVKKPIDKINRSAKTSANSLDAFADKLDKIVAELPSATVAPVK
ncbi:DUF2959 family protein [Rariglobus hedericola]|uniref:DUF2959 family protein n=1 Tax=Rariglobus hedericola TaxID=2597822 RepID=A0A556QQ47_9BACT|nr:DUF2959 family protein [Rariglobus hedericola]TSJ78751.1 hypothetical protein FPL22_05435 [Rariglobus hedericola]